MARGQVRHHPPDRRHQVPERSPGHRQGVAFVRAIKIATKAANEQINSITQKPLKDAVIAASWSNLEFTHDPIASSLQTSADNAHAVGLLDEVDLKGIYSLDLLNELLQAKGEAPVKGL